MQLLTEITALKEFKSKYGLDYDLPETKLSEVLFVIYHNGYETMLEHATEEYREALGTYTKEKWQLLVTDLNAILSQLTENNYKILLADVNQ